MEREPRPSDTLAEKMFGFNPKDYIKRDLCVPSPIGCGGVADEFRDMQSRKEYSMSGMCQSCQDKFFSTEEDEDA